jgi:lysophospholipase L1-like esterase
MPPSRYSPLDAGMPSRSAVNPATKIKYFIAKDKTGNTLGANGWLDHIQKNRERILGGETDIDYVFAGDSLMHLWETRGREFLKELNNPRGILHLGFSGDRTEDLQWRLKYGELNNYRAKNIALLIGTNNPAADGADGIVSGVKACLEAVAAKQPQARIFLHTIFPRRDGPQGIDGPMATRPIHDAANEQIRKLADGKKVVLVDFASCFLDENNDTKWIMPDRLHPSRDGFRIWYNELKKRFVDSKEKEKCNE